MILDYVINDNKLIQELQSNPVAKTTSKGDKRLILEGHNITAA